MCSGLFAFIQTAIFSAVQSTDTRSTRSRIDSRPRREQEMTPHPRIGIFVISIGLAAAIVGFAQEPQPQGAVLGKPIVRDVAPRGGDGTTLPRVLINQKPTPLAIQPPPAGAPVLE